MDELKLYKLCCTDDNDYGSCMASELGWVSDTKFLIWVNYIYLGEFINALKELFGYGLFDDGGFDANMQEDGVCIDLCEALEDYVDLKDIFPTEKYQH